MSVFSFRFYFPLFSTVFPGKFLSGLERRTYDRIRPTIPVVTVVGNDGLHPRKGWEFGDALGALPGS